jgi:hypothetical protein
MTNHANNIDDYVTVIRNYKFEQSSDILLKMTRQFLNLLKLWCLDFLGKFNYKNVNIPKVSIQKRKKMSSL